MSISVFVDVLSVPRLRYIGLCVNLVRVYVCNEYGFVRARLRCESSTHVLLVQTKALYCVYMERWRLAILLL